MSPFELSLLHVSVHGPPWFDFEPPQLLNFDSDGDPDPAFDSGVHRIRERITTRTCKTGSYYPTSMVWTMTKPSMRLTPFVGTGGWAPSSSHGGYKYCITAYIGTMDSFWRVNIQAKLQPIKCSNRVWECGGGFYIVYDKSLKPP
jgi:hypothetical protein